MWVTNTVLLVCFFFFSSRRRHTRFDCDWSSDVCSSDRAIGEFARIQPPSEAVWERFAGALSYVAGAPADASLYPRLERALKDAEATRSGPANRLFYCATPPSLYDDNTANLGGSGPARPG